MGTSLEAASAAAADIAMATNTRQQQPLEDDDLDSKDGVMSSRGSRDRDRRGDRDSRDRGRTTRRDRERDRERSGNLPSPRPFQLVIF